MENNGIKEKLSDVEIVFIVETYRREHDYCSEEDACDAKGVNFTRFSKAKRWLQEELEKLIEEIKELLKKKKEDEEYHKGLRHAEELRRLWDEEREEEEQKRREQEDWSISM